MAAAGSDPSKNPDERAGGIPDSQARSTHSVQVRLGKAGLRGAERQAASSTRGGGGGWGFTLPGDVIDEECSRGTSVVTSRHRPGRVTWLLLPANQDPFPRHCHHTGGVLLKTETMQTPARAHEGPVCLKPCHRDTGRWGTLG